jgi:cation:H+ antiporter
VIAPLIVNQQLIRLDVPLMIGASVVVWVLAADGAISRWEGVLLFAGIVTYTVFLVWQSRREGKEIQDEYADEFGAPAPRTAGAWFVNLGLLVVGLAMLVLGSRWLVNGAVTIAAWLGVSELIIGLTIVAAGTSLPEVATSVIASVRGERDIAVGNVVGSNLFNLLAVLGLAGMVAPAGVAVASHVLYFDMVVMVAVAVACLPIFFTGHLIARWEGVIFLGYYVAYTAYVVMAAQASTWQPLLRDVMLYFAVPLTVLTLGIAVWRAVRPAAELEA